MYPYDFVNVLQPGARRDERRRPARPLVGALNEVETRGANGDERGFNEKNHEGVIDDDTYFASFHDMTYAPVVRRSALVDAADDPADVARPPRRRAPAGPGTANWWR